MNTFAKIPIVVILVILAWLGLQALASESGEVVSLTTYDSAGRTRITRLWVVEYEGAQWLRAGSSSATWFARLRKNPDIHVLRNGRNAVYRALPEPKLRKKINSLMRLKYGWRDEYISIFYSRQDSVPIRLKPLG